MVRFESDFSNRRGGFQLYYEEIESEYSLMSLLFHKVHESSCCAKHDVLFKGSTDDCNLSAVTAGIIALIVILIIVAIVVTIVVVIYCISKQNRGRGMVHTTHRGGVSVISTGRPMPQQQPAYGMTRPPAYSTGPQAPPPGQPPVYSTGPQAPPPAYPTNQPYPPPQYNPPPAAPGNDPVYPPPGPQNLY